MKDIWTQAIEQGRSAPTEPGAPEGARGRVLRVKGGYNPNSSSVGSSIPMFLVAAASSGAIAVVLLNALGVIGKLVGKRVEAERDIDGPSPTGDDGEPEAAASESEPTLPAADEGDDQAEAQDD